MDKAHLHPGLFFLFQIRKETEKTMTTTTAGRNLQTERNHQSISLSQMATDLQIEESMLMDYEEGRMALTEMEGLRIALYLKIEPAVIGIEPLMVLKRIPNHFLALVKRSKGSSQKNDGKSGIAAFKQSFTKRSKSEKIETLENVLFHPEKMKEDRPFMFLRIALGLCFIFLLAYAIFEVSIMLISLSLLVPFTLLWYLFERNNAHALSGLVILRLFLFGGLISICFVYMIRNYVGYPDLPFLGELLTGIVEETAKILCVILFVHRIKLENTISGILVGFAVGAGFDVFETASYGISSLINSELDIDVMNTDTLIRSAYSLFGIGHHYWTGMLAGALVSVSKTGYVKLRDLFHPVVFGWYIIVIMFHTFFNYSLTRSEGFFWEIVLGVLSLLLFFLMWKNSQNDYADTQSEKEHDEKERSMVALVVPVTKSNMDLPLDGDSSASQR